MLLCIIGNLQCLLNFLDNHKEDGGTILVKCFYRYLFSWNATHLDRCLFLIKQQQAGKVVVIQLQQLGPFDNGKEGLHESGKYSQI
jgi:hypothetical protein